MTTMLEDREARIRETTRCFRRLAQPILRETPMPKPDVHLLAPRPWPRGEFIMNPEG